MCQQKVLKTENVHPPYSAEADTPIKHLTRKSDALGRYNVQLKDWIQNLLPPCSLPRTAYFLTLFCLYSATSPPKNAYVTHTANLYTVSPTPAFATSNTPLALTKK